MKIVKQLKFWKGKIEFPKMLREDMKKVQTSKKTLTPADKTYNMYRLNNNNYQNLLRNAIKITCKTQLKTLQQKPIKKGIKFSKQEDTLDKTEMNDTNSLVTLKGHKVNFINHATATPINPSKNEIGRISRCILDQINTKLVN